VDQTLVISSIYSELSLDGTLEVFWIFNSRKLRKSKALREIDEGASALHWGYFEDNEVIAFNFTEVFFLLAKLLDTRV
jgi:hypothetical protein